MARKYPAITFSESVKEAQDHYGSRAIGERLEAMPLDDETLGFAELAFLAARDGFYLASVNDEGWPYVQFRGGPQGFLKPLDARTLGYLDYRGNRQYITTGNVRANDRVALIFMDYPNRRRLKLLARAEVVDALERPDLVERLEDPGYAAVVERAVLFHVVAYDWNCPQHITPRWTEEEWDERERERG